MRIIQFIAPTLVLAAFACDSGGSDSSTDTVGDSAGPVDSTAPADTTAPATAVVVLNEVGMDGTADWVELYNAGGAAANLSGWVFRDDDPLHAYVFPNDTILPAGSYFLLERGAAGFDFGLGGADTANLLSGANVIDSTAWADVGNNFSWGRFPNGDGAWGELYVPTPGAANVVNVEVACPNGRLDPTEACDTSDFGTKRCEDYGFGGGSLTCRDSCQTIAFDACEDRAPGLVINEVTAFDDDRIELFNGTNVAIELAGYVVADENDATYTIPASTTLSGQGYLVLIKGIDHTFGLSSNDLVELRNPAGAVVDRADWRGGQADVSYCRIPNGVGGFQSCPVPSFGRAND